MKNRLAWFAEFLFAAVVAPVANAQTVWSVDPSGAGDFTSVAVAVASVAEGDILAIEPGNYGSVVVTKALSLLGNPNQAQRPEFVQLTVDGAARCDLAHLSIDFLLIKAVPGRSRVDDCLTSSYARFEDVQELFVRGSNLVGQSQPNQGEPGASVLATGTQSRVQFVNCRMRGGDGWVYDLNSGAGAPGVRCLGADVRLFGCSLRGGTGANHPFGNDGVGGSALLVISGNAELRGSVTDLTVGGPGDATAPQSFGFACDVGPAATAVSSGVSLMGAVSGALQQVADRPYLHWRGTGGLGSARDLELYGGVGDLGVALLSLGSRYDTSFQPLYGLPLTLDLGSLFLTQNILLQGQDTPASLPFVLPLSAQFAGLAVPTQAGVLSASGAVLTNGDDLLLSY
jgi:hypothetical protein